MKKIIPVVIAGALAVSIMTAAAPAATAASTTPVVRSGKCSGTSTWLLTLKIDNGRIEVDSEVNHTRNGQVWKFVFKDNLVVFARAKVVAGSPGNDPGQASATRYVRPVAGANHIMVRSRDYATGQFCVASATF